MPAPRCLLACVAAILTACTTTTAGEGSPGAAAGVALPAGGACGEVFFWAASDSGDVAVTVYVDVVDRSPDGPTRLTVDLPDDEVQAVVLTGRDLPVNFCTDVIDGRSEPTGTQQLTAGTLTVDLDPPGEDCGESDGRLRAEGLVADDGTTFAPVDVRSGLVGCDVGG